MRASYCWASSKLLCRLQAMIAQVITMTAIMPAQKASVTMMMPTPMTAMATPMGPVMAAAMATPMGPVMAAKPAQVTTVVTMPTKVATVVAAMPTQAVIVVVAIPTKAATGRVVMPTQTQVQNVVVIKPIQPTTVAADVPTTVVAMPTHGETAVAAMRSQAPNATVIPCHTTTLPMVVKMSNHDNLSSESYGDDTSIITGKCDDSSVLFFEFSACDTEAKAPMRP